MKSAQRTHLPFLILSGLWAFSCIELNQNPDDVEDGGSGGIAGEHPGGRGGSAPTGGMSGTSGNGAVGGASGSAGESGRAGDGGASAGEGGDAGAGGNGGTSGGGTSVGGTSGTTPGGAGAGGTDSAGSGGQPLAGAGGTGGEAGGGEGATGGDDGCLDYRVDPENPPQLIELTGSLRVHDPVVIRAGSQYYLFHTGPRIQVKTSPDLKAWSDAAAVFPSNPSWIASAVPGATDLWAPDISYFGDRYHLYYSASTFGSQRSCIGHATRGELDDTEGWTDHGAVICSNPTGGNSDDWNAIDPNVILDEQGTPWLSFGSFWGGIKMIELDATGARANANLHALAARFENDRSIEAPFIVRRCNYYYLFVSFDFCCRRSNSTYRIMVGRSENLLGPYLDRRGTPMLEGGGTQVLAADNRWKGPGHNAVLIEGYDVYNVYHAYDSFNLGNSYLRISEMAWDVSGWPVSAGP